MNTTNKLELAVVMADGSFVVVKRLLGKGDDNVKLAKSDKAQRGYLTFGLSLAPAMTSGYQTCPHASAGCMKACIFTSGHAQVFKSIGQSRIAKTRAWFQSRELFKAMLLRDIRAAIRKGTKERKRVAIRLNVFSDIPWERVFPDLFTMFPKVQFYDYTKNVQRAIAHAQGAFPANYHLTFSRSETNERDCLNVLANNGSVTVVFDKKTLPTTWNGFAVVNGDETDLRFMDKRGAIIGLYAKGAGRKDTSGFVVQTERVPLTLA